MQLILQIALWVVAIPAVPSCAYVFALTLLSARLPRMPASQRKLRFDVIVPAHNEESVIAAVVRSIKVADWPADCFRVIVVADNCTDATAAIAEAEGAHVIRRLDSERRGKGYALDFAFQASRAKRWADAVVVIDADARVSSNLLEAFACRLERGENAVQAHYGVTNVMASWRTRLLSISKSAFHIVRSRARERLKLSCGIRGNGWCVTHHLLEQVPYQAFSLTEDLEYGITLGLAGFRVAYADEAHSNAEMVSGEKDARRQRQRWEQGRFGLMRHKTLPLLRSAFGTRSRLSLDLALDLVVLPLSYVACNVVLLIGLAAVATFRDPHLAGWLWLSIACLAALCLHVLRGWQLSGAGLQGLLDLARAPFFLVWKVLVMLTAPDSREWVRTKRENSSEGV